MEKSFCEERNPISESYSQHQNEPGNSPLPHPALTFMEAIQRVVQTQEDGSKAPHSCKLTSSNDHAPLEVKREEEEVVVPASSDKDPESQLGDPSSASPHMSSPPDLSTEASPHDPPYPYSVSWMHALAVRWQRAAAHHPEGLGVGCVVFAPKPPARGGGNVSCVDLHVQYALAEITGIQSADGTVTVSFLFSSPGAEEEQVSIFDVIPSTEVWKDGCMHFHEGGMNNAHSASLLERLLRLPLHSGPMPEDYLYRRVIDGYQDPSAADSPASSGMSQLIPLLRAIYGEEGSGGQEQTGREGIHRPNDSPSQAVSPSGAGSEARQTIISSGQPWRFSYNPSQSIHECYAEAFRELDHAIAEDYWALTGGHPPPRSSTSVVDRISSGGGTKSYPPTILCVFDEFSLLQRFDIFMSTRGHNVTMLDGDISVSDEKGVFSQALFQSPVQEYESHLLRKRKRSGHSVDDDAETMCKAPRRKITRYAFNNPCKEWFCMLMDDLDPLDNLSSLLVNAPTIDYLLFVSSQEEMPVVVEKNGDSLARKELQEQLKNLLSPFLVCSSTVLLTGFPSIPSISTSYSSLVSTENPRVEKKEKRTHSSLHTVKISGQIFEGRKIMVPPSPEQLLLLATVTSFQETQQENNLETISQGKKLKTSVGSALSERIALGTFTNSSADHLFSAYSMIKAEIPSGTHMVSFSSIEELHHNFYSEPSLFGNSFPVYAIARGIAQDAYAAAVREASRNGTSRVSFVPPRIALVLPRGNPCGNPQLALSRFVASLKEYFSAWSVYEVLPGRSSAERNQTSRWSSQGGVLLLYCDEIESQMSTIHTEADVVIACGKRAATWIAATIGGSESAVQCYAVISEIEVVSISEDHTWTPYRPPSVMSSVTQTAEIETLWTQLRQFFSSLPEGRSRLPISKVLQHSMSLWFYLENKSCSCLRGFAKAIALSVATTPFIRLSELRLTECG